MILHSTHRTIFFPLLLWLTQSLATDYSPAPEERSIVDATTHPWSAIGRVNRAGTGHCTGVLITPSRVLTAAHCLWNPITGAPLPVTELHFLAGYQKEQYLAHGRVKSLFISPQYNPDTSDFLERAEADWAVMKLSSPLDGIKPLPLISPQKSTLKKIYRNGSKIEQAGYRRDRQYVLTRDDNCMLYGFIKGKQLLAHSCKAIGGDSGSPLIVNDGKQRHVIAIHVGRVTESGRELGLAVPTGAMSDVGKK